MNKTIQKSIKISEKTIGRLSVYLRYLLQLQRDKIENIYSHQLARLAGVTAAQLRRDLMSVGYTGSPIRGYEVNKLVDSISNFLDDPNGQNMALIGIGNLGRAIIAYFSGRRPNLKIVAAFDSNPDKVHRVTHGCRCYPLEQLREVIQEQAISTGIITVPAPEAQDVANQLVEAGVNGILNFAPVRLNMPPEVFVEDIDLAMSLEKVAYFARKN